MTREKILLDEIAAEFPSFSIKKKSESPLQHVIHVLLMVLTFGGQREYLTRYRTVLFGKLYVPDDWYSESSDERYIVLCHERVHLRQRKRLGDLAMTFLYLIPFFPLFLAYGRARLEWEAYEETVRATFEVRGLAAAKALRNEIVRRFVGGDYGFMWPFPQTVGRWFDACVASLAEGAVQEALEAGDKSE